MPSFQLFKLLAVFAEHRASARHAGVVSEEQETLSRRTPQQESPKGGLSASATGFLQARRRTSKQMPQLVGQKLCPNSALKKASRSIITTIARLPPYPID